MRTERRRIRKLKWMGVMALVVLLGLSACSGGRGSPAANIDPSGVDGTLATEPEVVKAGEPVKLIATVTGLPVSEDTTVKLEVRYGTGENAGRAELIPATRGSGNAFTATYTFPKAGTFHVYLHIYHLDLHITKLKKVEVT